LIDQNMPTLSLPGVDLHFETIGSGPLLLLITGAEGRGAGWQPLAQEFSTRYTVAYYDRRGFSDSIITGAQDYTNRLGTDVDDAASLITHLSPGEGATVIGSSSGAIVALNMLLKYPSKVLKLLCHEPPAFGVLPPQHQAMGKGMVNHIYDVYTKAGPIAAMEAFTGGLAVGEEGTLIRSLTHPGHSHEIRANSQFWFQFELRQYPTAKVDLDGLIALKDKFVPAAGVESGNEVGVAPIAAIAQAMEKEILRLPGGHLGFVSDPESWATTFLQSIDKY
jgi:pimeloyl-ACP methyl ester carboxylesterase